MRVGGQRHARFTPVNRPGTHRTGGWVGAKNLALAGIRSPDRPARRESLYLLSYPDSHLNSVTGCTECEQSLKFSIKRAFTTNPFRPVKF